MNLMVGIPASGKTTFANLRFRGTHSIVSLDALKTRFRENSKLEEAARNGENIAVDNTNITRAERAKYISFGRENGYKIACYFFEPDAEQSLKRNENPGRAKVPRVAIFDKLKRLERPGFSEGFDEIYQVQTGINTFKISPWEKE